MALLTTDRPDISYSRLHELTTYNPETGEFIANKTIGNKEKGAVLGTNSDKGYIRTALDKKIYRNHRLAFLYMTGIMPLDEVDHINGNTSDNRWENLRLATSFQNMANKPMNNNNTIGIKGIVLYGHRYRASVTVNYKRHQKYFYIRDFPSKEATLQEAVQWVTAKREQLHGEFARHE